MLPVVCPAPRSAEFHEYIHPVKADEFTESRDLHEIYRRQACFRFAVSSIAQSTSYSSKVVGTFLALEISSLVTVRQRGWRNASARSANHLCRATVLRSVSSNDLKSYEKIAVRLRSSKLRDSTLEIYCRASRLSF